MIRAFSQHESTVGAAVTIAWHDYRAGSAEQRPEQLELWDVGGAAAHRPASTVFLDSAAGVILVHDLTNSKSEVNLGQWLSLVNGDRRVHSSYSLHSLIADIESSNVPILVVGTKLDLAPDRSKAKSEHSQDRSRVALLSGVTRVELDCRKELIAGSTTAMTIARFLDAAIDRTKTPQVEKRRTLYS